jgi:ankyrin repeat protein
VSYFSVVSNWCGSVLATLLAVTCSRSYWSFGSPRRHPQLRRMWQAIAITAIPLLLGGCATTLFDAAKSGNLADARKLLDTGADVNERDSDQWTPLMYAANFRNAEMVSELLAKKADVNAKNVYGWTALMLAARKGNKDSVAMLLDAGADVNAANSKGSTPLLLAVRYGNLGTVSQLLAHKANVNAKNSSGWSPIMFAAGNIAGHNEQDAKEVFSLLLAAGADVNAVNKDGWTSLHVTTRNEREHSLKDVSAMVTALIAAGANVNAVASDGMTPLMFAVRFGDSKLVAALLNKGAEINVRSQEGLTPLLLAAGYGSTETLSLLLSAGADATAKLPDGTTSLILLASRQADYLSVTLVRQGLAYVWTEANVGTGDRISAAMAKALIDKRVDVNAKDSNGWSALMAAAHNVPQGWTGLVSVLLQAGADTSAQNNKGETAASLARGNQKVLELLEQPTTTLKTSSLDTNVPEGKGREEALPLWLVAASNGAKDEATKLARFSSLHCILASGLLMQSEDKLIINKAQTCTGAGSATYDWIRSSDSTGFSSKLRFLEALSWNTIKPCIHWGNPRDLCEELADFQWITMGKFTEGNN